MTREIKFRAWDKEIKMSRSFNVFDAGEMVKSMIFAGGSTTEMPIIMQYTGLKDKNGKEIYEGDFIGVEYTVGEGFAFYFTAEMPDVYERIGIEKWVILGNVYENPELLHD